MEYLYRYERSVSFEGKTSIILRRFQVTKKTDKTAWVSEFGTHGRQKIVRTSADRPWAYPTEPEAFEHFCHRTKFSVRICEDHLNQAKEFLEAIKSNTIEKLDHNYKPFPNNQTK